METHFEVTHQVVEGKQLLTFSPKHTKGNNFKPKSIEITQDQWNELRYHFATGVNDKTKQSILAYII